MSAPRCTAPTPCEAVAEVAGWDGAYTLSERVVQKVWLRRDCAQSTQTLGGARLTVREPGTWNLQAGPDFKDGCWQIEGIECRGDVEVHLRARDWFGHGHDTDPAYNGVRLHVVLFPPRPGEPCALTEAGGRPDTIVLLPLLRCGLEELALEDALAELTGRDYLGLAESWAALGTARLRATCAVLAERRWRSKVGFARQRLERQGWEQACHVGALEVLGLRANRAAMATVGLRWDLEAFRRERPTVETLLGCEAAAWHWRGVRPNNRPDARLRQYLSWVEAAPDWTRRVETWAADVRRLGVFPDWRQEEVGSLRRACDLAGALERFAGQVVWGCVGGTRLHNLVADLALPLAAASAEAQGYDCGALAAAWAAWWPADAPDEVLGVLRASGLLEEGRPITNGLVQAVLGAAIEARRGGTASS